MTGPVNGAGAPSGAPAPTNILNHIPAQGSSLVDALREFLPQRSAEERAYGEIHIQLGNGEKAEQVRIPVLSHRLNRDWQTSFTDGWKGVVDAMSGDESGAVVMNLLMGQTDLQLDLLASYSPDLLSRDKVESLATDEQILDAFLKVTAAAFPFPVRLLEVALANAEVQRWARLQLVQLLYSSSSSSSRPSTGGRRRRSKS